MTQHYSVVVERESNGTFSAWVAGLPGVYAAADTAAVAKRAIRSALEPTWPLSQNWAGLRRPRQTSLSCVTTHDPCRVAQHCAMSDSAH